MKKKKITVSDSLIHRQWGNLKADGGLQSLSAFARSQKNSYNIKELERSLSKIPAFSLHRQNRKRVKRPAIIINSAFTSYCVDLIQLTSLSNYNSNYGWILVLLDQFRKYISLQPLKQKTTKLVSVALEKALKELSAGGKYFPNVITSDSGLEFRGKETQAVLKKYNIKHYLTKPPRHAVFCEAAVKKTKTLMFRWMTLNKTKRWLDIVPEVANKINNTVHDSTKMKPKDINRSNETVAFENMYRKLALTPIKKGKFSVGDICRISGARNIFTKSYVPGFSKKLYRVKIKREMPPVTTYRLETLDGEEVPYSFVDSELSLAALEENGGGSARSNRSKQFK